MATMSIDYQTLKFEYRPRAARAAGDDAVIHPVIVVGAGPVGLSAAIDLAQQGVPVVLLDDDDTLSTGSRAICFAKRTLEIFDRLGCGERFVEKGVSWHVGKVFLQDEQLYAFDLLPEEGMRVPRSSTCSSTTSKAIWPNARSNCRTWRFAGSTR